MSGKLETVRTRHYAASRGAGINSAELAVRVPGETCDK